MLTGMAEEMKFHAFVISYAINEFFYGANNQLPGN